MKNVVPKAALKRSNLERIWAPWRLKYIESTLIPSSDCFLCDASLQEVCYETLTVWQDETTLVIMNRFPYNNGHLLIAPRKHVGDISDLTILEGSALFASLQRATGWLTAVYSPHGFNIGMNLGRVAGAGLPGHLHIHLVPRWSGDVNFMTVVGEVKVISESLEVGWERIRAVVVKNNDPVGS